MTDFLNTPGGPGEAAPDYSRAGYAPSRKPPASQPGAFEQLDADLVTLKGTKGRPVPHRTRRLAIALVFRAGRSRVAHLTPEVRDGLTDRQLAASLARLTAWPAAEPLVRRVEGGKVHLRPLPRAWVRAYRWVYQSRLDWDAKLAIWTIRAGKFLGLDDEGNELFAYNRTGRRWPSLADCAAASDRARRGRGAQLHRAACLDRFLRRAGLVKIVETRTGRRQGPAVCVLLDHRRPGAGGVAAAPERGVSVPPDPGHPPRPTLASHHDPRPLTDCGVTPRSAERHTTVHPTVTPRHPIASHHATSPTPPSDSSPIPSPDPRAADRPTTRAAELPRVERCAFDGGGFATRQGTGPVVSARPAPDKPAPADPPSWTPAGRKPSSDHPRPCEPAPRQPVPCEPAPRQPTPCEPATHRPAGPPAASLGPGRGPAAPEPLGAAPAPRAEDGPGKALVRHDPQAARAALLAHHGRAVPAAAPRPRPTGLPVRLLALVRDIEENGYGPGNAYRLKPSLLGLKTVARRLYDRRADLPEGWDASDFRVAFESSELDGLRERSWGLVVSDDEVWRRFAAVLARRVAQRLELQAWACEQAAKAAEAAAGPDPVLRTRAGRYYLEQRDPHRAVPLLVEAVGHPAAADLAAEGLYSWGVVGSEERPGDLVALARDRLAEVVETLQGDARWNVEQVLEWLEPPKSAREEPDEVAQLLGFDPDELEGELERPDDGPPVVVFMVPQTFSVPAIRGRGVAGC